MYFRYHVAGLDFIDNLSKSESDRNQALNHDDLLEVPRIHESALTVWYNRGVFLASVIILQFFLSEHEG